ncbi:MAG: dTDP-4-dehydrorhamnose reductase [Thermodesulfobacteriota bacterium]
MKILVLGARGMLGQDLVPLLSLNYEAIARDIQDFDITNAQRVEEEILRLKPQVVINAAAYTDVDGCESNRELALSVNAKGAGNIAQACALIQAKLIHLSTDYVFDGSSADPYQEDDRPNPLNVYGLSKLQGELAIKESGAAYLIIRTQWLYGAHGRNFVDTIIKAAQKEKELRVVNDQRGSPTYTKDLSSAIKEILEKNAQGIIHVANSGSCTWYEFAKEILQQLGMKQIPIKPISSAELARPAKRPANSVLNCQKFEKISGRKMRPWQEALRDYLTSRY